MLDREDLKQLDLNVESDRLYLVKWRDLSYSEATWESEQVFGCP
jgi:hypothetical protein